MTHKNNTQKLTHAHSDVSEDDWKYSFLPTTLFMLAGLSLFIGVILCVNLWPSAPSSWQPRLTTTDFIPAITWLLAGVVQFAIYASIGKGLHYLKEIAQNTKQKLDS